MLPAPKKDETFTFLKILYTEEMKAAIKAFSKLNWLSGCWDDIKDDCVTAIKVQRDGGVIFTLSDGHLPFVAARRWDMKDEATTGDWFVRQVD